MRAGKEMTKQYRAVAPQMVNCMTCSKEWPMPASGMVHSLRCCGASTFRWDDAPKGAYENRVFVQPRLVPVRELTPEEEAQQSGHVIA